MDGRRVSDSRVIFTQPMGVDAGLAALLAGRGGAGRWSVWPVMAAVAVVGAAGPAWAYLVVRPVVAAVLRQPVGIGPGVGLNALAGALVAAVCLLAWRWLVRWQYFTSAIEK